MNPDTILVRARDVTVRLGDADDVRVMIGDERLESTAHALTILHAFGQPRSVADVLASVAAGPEGWIEVSTTILQLANAGVLIPPGTDAAAPKGYQRPSIHVVMLDDHVRTRGFIDALRKTVRHEDVVLDIGTGSGVLATTAALAGASKVFAVESSAIGDAAERVFAANGVGDRVALVRGRSTSITLPKRCGVLVTEVIGNDPLDEKLLEIVADAKHRLLLPDARLIPCAIEIVGVPVDVPRRIFERHCFTTERITAWRAAYGVDFSPLMSVRLTEAQPIMVETSDVLGWSRVADPVSIVDIDLTAPFETVLRARASFALTRDVARLGVLLAFRATLAPGIVLSTLPEVVDPLNHWRYALFPSFERPSFLAGAVLTIDYAYDRETTTLRTRPA